MTLFKFIFSMAMAMSALIWITLQMIPAPPAKPAPDWLAPDGNTVKSPK
jgi:hypothetical protein